MNEQMDYEEKEPTEEDEEEEKEKEGIDTLTKLTPEMFEQNNRMLILLHCVCLFCFFTIR